MHYVLVDPDSTLNFSHNWLEYLAEGELIATRQWTITPLNPGTPATPVLVGDTTAIVFVSGCQAGKVYRLTERVVINSGVVDDRTIVLRCEFT